jgi:two-component system chemotaxis response regulator CheB
MNALQAGALAVLEKPVGTSSAEYAKLAGQLCTHLVIMSQVKVVRRRGTSVRAQRLQARPASPAGIYQILGIVSSTGGPNALVQLLGGLGQNFPLPILLVQHITDSFLEGFASWLGSVCPFSFVIVKDRAMLAPGTVFLAAPGHHLRAEGGYLQADRGEPICSQRPSGNALFESMAYNFGRRAMGVILTGMGDDGAEGLLQIRKKGGYTIAEDESTAVVYGMPAEAVRLGAVCESLPIPEIAPRILDLTLSRERVA